MSLFRTIISEIDLQKDMLLSFQEQRLFKQNVFYFGSGAESYYEAREIRKTSNIVPFTTEEGYDIFTKNIPLQKGIKYALISIGCGNAAPEKELLNKLYEDGYDLSYFGIDSSMPMLELAEKNLNHSQYPKQFICADFASELFRSEIGDITQGHEVRIFMFLGFTLGNVPQGYIADILSDIMKPNDYLWVDTLVRKDLTEKSNYEYYKTYSKFLNDSYMTDFLMAPLLTIGNTASAGELYLTMEHEEAINSLKFQFGFRFLEKSVITYKGKKVTLLPGDCIQLIYTRLYDPKGLINFFLERDFIFLDQLLKLSTGQFFFKKQ